MGSNWPAWLWLVVNALATYRLRRLITDDLITDPLRTRVIALGEPWAADIQCPWCVWFWVAVLVVATAAAFPAPWTPLAVVLTLSAVSGFLASHE